MSELFATPEVTETSENKRGIPGAQLVKTKAISMASELMAKIPGADEDFIEKIKESQSDVTALDNLVKDTFGERLNDPQVAELGEEEVGKILKSNQSNRSRRKSMPMTQSNYVELLTAAIAEWLIRESCGIKKSAGGFGAGRQSLVINDETLAELAEDQDALGRAIRNIQSKKSTYKAKHADNPDYVKDTEWLELLDQEAKLKAIRTTQPAGRKGLSMKKALQFIFDGVGETEHLGKDECYQIITACRNLSTGVYPEAYVDMVAAKEAEKAAKAESAIIEDEVMVDDVYADEDTELI